MTLEEEVALLRTEIQELREELAAAQERIAELERVWKGPPSFVKAKRSQDAQEKKPRRKRGAEAPKTLTPREREISTLIARGFSNMESGHELGISDETVKTHVSHILSKLGLPDRYELRVYALRQGLVDEKDLPVRVMSIPRASWPVRGI